MGGPCASQCEELKRGRWGEDGEWRGERAILGVGRSDMSMFSAVESPAKLEAKQQSRERKSELTKTQ